MIQAAFLISLLIGVLALVAAISFARLNWRSDIEPYSRRTRLHDLALNLDDYVLPEVVTKVRVLLIAGIILLVIAIGTLVCQFIQDFLIKE